jgi:hypothetical protein
MNPAQRDELVYGRITLEVALKEYNIFAKQMEEHFDAHRHAKIIRRIEHDVCVLVGILIEAPKISTEISTYPL